MTDAEVRAWEEGRDDASARANRCNRVLNQYIKHVGTCEGVTFLESKYRAMFTGTHEDWDSLRAMAGVTR